jgi:UDP-2,4-diacetamido-2,4,6-trideoxy-beta-L-altropyranose hydrolase
MMGLTSVVFRTEGGAEIGFGHVRRCLALAAALGAHGAQTVFLVDGDPGVLDQVRARGLGVFPVHRERDVEETLAVCETRAAVLVVDSYGIDASGLRVLAERGPRVAAIDDLADRELPVDLVVNGSAGAERLPYRGAPRTRYLLGPRYVLLQPEFASLPERVLSEHARHVLITVGGGDPTGLTLPLTRCVARALPDATLDVVIGPWFGHADALREAVASMDAHVVLHEAPADMRALMLTADVAVSGGGQTTYELAATGTPTVGIRLADNQRLNLDALADAGALVPAGDVEDPELESTLAAALTSIAKDPDRRAEMSRRARALVDGHGAARVAQEILRMAGALAA